MLLGGAETVGDAQLSIDFLAKLGYSIEDTTSE